MARSRFGFINDASKVDSTYFRFLPATKVDLAVGGGTVRGMYNDRGNCDGWRKGFFERGAARGFVPRRIDSKSSSG